MDFSIATFIFGFLFAFEILRELDMSRLGQKPTPLISVYVFISTLIIKSRKILLPTLGIIVLLKAYESFAPSLSGAGGSSCSGNGDASCEGAVMAHINGIQDKEVNFINYIGDGRFSVNIIDVSNGGLAVGGSYSKNVRTDCNCTIVGF